MASRYVKRVASRLKFVISSVIQSELQDPRLGFVTVLGVEPTADFKEAKVTVSVYGSEGDRSRTVHALEDSRGFIQKRIAQALDLRNTPVLRFVLDRGENPVERIERILESEREGASAPEAPESEAEAPDPPPE